MSQIHTTDLLCRARREELTLDEQRRLDESLEHSLEVKLVSQILAELDRESCVRPGDELLLARINARALATLSNPVRGPAKRRPFSMLLVAAAVLSVAVVKVGPAQMRFVVMVSTLPVGTWRPLAVGLRKPSRVAGVTH